MSFIALTTAETDSKSPLDDLLFQKIKDNFDDLNSRVIAAGAAPFAYEVQGKLIRLTNYMRSIGGMVINKEFTPTLCRFGLKKSGLSDLEFDIRQHTQLNIPITQISHQYSATTSSISRRGSALNTQSISRAGAQIATQSITHAKAANNIQSIILLGDIAGLGNDLVQINLAVTIDSDTVVGDSAVIASASSGGNNGTFTILDKNRAGGNNIVISNASGVAQTSAAGTVQLKIMSYNFTNPVDTTVYVAGYSVQFASHTSGANDGAYTIFAVNSGGNNILVKNSAGVTQGGAVGSADTNLFKFNMSTSVSSTDYIVGEKALTASHSTGANNGSFTIAAVNLGGNNVVLNVPGGATQGGVAGTVNTYRWDYNLPSDPTSQVSVGYNMHMSGHSSSVNDGDFVVKALTASTIVVYNESGATQGGSAGLIATHRKLVKFASDQASNFTTLSFIEMQACADTSYNYYFATSPFSVLEINRGGGSNYNVVIENASGTAQDSPAGYVQVEMKSIFNANPVLASDTTSLEGNQNLTDSSTDFITSLVIAVNTPLMLYITDLPSGDPRDFSVILT